MSSDRGYILTPQAQDDMENIWRYTAENWSLTQADKYVRELTDVFAILASMPMMARVRREFTPPVRIHVHERHVVIYVMDGSRIAIVRILGGQQDWLAILTNSEP